MLILIAESKTMLTALRRVTPQQYSLHCPLFESEADAAAEMLRKLPQPLLAERLRLGPKSASDAFKAYYDFPDKSTGIKAIEAFTGVVFRNLDYSSLNEAQKDFASRHIRIISSLYGLLRPDDTIKPYRLDFNSHIVNDTETPMKFWRDKISSVIANEAADNDYILNLLPKDAADCIDWTQVGSHSEILTADFKIQSGDRLVTPQAGKLKTMRGHLLRQIILDHITTPSGLHNLATESSQHSPELSEGNRLLFIGA